MTMSAVEMRHLRLVAAISEHGSMTAAATVLNLTQPALSHQLREIEQRLRAPLFVRTSRRMVPTPAGAQLVELARGVLAQVETFEQQAHAGDFATARGAVRIATQCYTAYHWLPSVLREFRDRWPNIELRVAAQHTSSPIAALREGLLDLAIVYTPSNDRRIELRPLFDDELVVVLPPGHCLASQMSITPAALRGEHVFVYTTSDRDNSVIRDILDPAGVPSSRITHIQLTEAIVELVAAGLGIAVLAEWAVAPAVRSGAVRTVRISKHGFNRTWYAAVRSADVTPAYRFDLIDLLARTLRPGPAVRDMRRT
jgi:LysR family transcriptional regulator, regulator for metE and metH